MDAVLQSAPGLISVPTVLPAILELPRRLASALNVILFSISDDKYMKQIIPFPPVSLASKREEKLGGLVLTAVCR